LIFGSLVLSPTGSINLGFITKGKLAVVLIITFSWGFPTSFLVSATNQRNCNQAFWRRCRGERGFLQGESLAFNILLYYCFALLYFSLHRFIKNTKKIASFIVVTLLLLVHYVVP
jgi:hypothetical protein